MLLSYVYRINTGLGDSKQSDIAEDSRIRQVCAGIT